MKIIKRICGTLVAYIVFLDFDLRKICFYISDKTQDLIGLTCYGIAKIGVGICAITVILQQLNFLFQFLSIKTSLVLFVINFVWIFVLLDYGRLCDKAQASVYDSILPLELMRYLTTSSLFSRIIWLGFLPLGLYSTLTSPPFSIASFLFSAGLDIGMLIYLYFMSILPKPPETSKLRQFFSSLFTHRTLAHQQN